jgi:hypothetical protein
MMTSPRENIDPQSGRESPDLRPAADAMEWLAPGG